MIVSLVAATLALPLVARAANYKSPDGSLVVTASVIDFQTTRVVARGKALVKATDKAMKSGFQAEAARITVELAPGALTGSKGSQADLIKDATFVGPVKIVHFSVTSAGVTVKTTATADRADYNGADKLLVLDGNVKIVQDNPEIFQEPAVATGEKAQVSIKPNLGPDEFRFRVESASEPSRIEVTLKKEEAKG